MSKLYDTIGSYTAVPNSIIELWPKIGVDGMALFLYLRFRTNGRSGVAFPSYDTISKDTCLTRNRIAKAIRALEVIAVLERKKRFSQSTLYTLKIPVKAKPLPASGAAGGLVDDAPEVQHQDSSSPTGGLSVVQQVRTNKTDINKTEDNKTENSAAKGAAPVFTVESDPWKGTPPQLVQVPQGGNKARRAEYTERCDQCQGTLTQDSDTCLSCGRPLKWEESTIADKRAKDAANRKSDEASKRRREQVERFSETTKHILAVARATAPVKAHCDYAKGEEDALHKYEQAYGSELVESKLIEFKANGDRGRGLIKHLINSLAQHNFDRPKKGAIIMDGEELARLARADLGMSMEDN